MKNKDVEEIITLATIFSTSLSKNCTKEQLIEYKIFFQTVTNNIINILSSKK